MLFKLKPWSLVSKGFLPSPSMSVSVTVLENLLSIKKYSLLSHTQLLRSLLSLMRDWIKCFLKIQVHYIDGMPILTEFS